MVDKDFTSIISNKTTLKDGCQSYAQQKTHDTRNGEETKGTLQVLFLCTIKRVVFIVDISNKYTPEKFIEKSYVKLRKTIEFWI